MTNDEFARAISRVNDTDNAAALARLEAELRAAYPGDEDADTVARQAGLKRQRLTRAN